ncbi:MAG TPA: hypothetical protein VEN81_02795 [Planctomycetota bacterium]|nr:hypothetical protein [Planctomycetota bacterium]
MKWLMWVGVAALAMSAVAVRSLPPETVPIVRRTAEVIGPAAVLSPVLSERPKSEPGDPISLIVPARPEEVPLPPTLPSTRDAEEIQELEASREENLLILEHELALSRSQRIEVGNILATRNAQIAAYHADLRASKTFFIAGHDRKAREILEESQARIARVLDGEQSRGYFRLIEEKRIVEGVAFQVTPDMTVIR